MGKVILLLLVLCGIGFTADTTKVKDNTRPMKIDTIPAGINYPSLQFITSDSIPVVTGDIIGITFQHFRPGTGWIENKTWRWNATNPGITADRVNVRIKAHILQ